MQGVRAAAVHERRGHKRLTSEDRKPSCFFRNRRDVYGASLTPRLEKRCLNVLPQDLSRLYLPVSTVSHYEFRGAAHPRACQDILARTHARAAFPATHQFHRFLFQLRFLLILRRRIRGGWNLISWVHAGEAAVFHCWWRCGSEGEGLAVQGYRCSKESRQHKHDELCLTRLLTECWSGAIVAAVENPSGETALQHRPRVPPCRYPLHLDKADLTRDGSSPSIFNHRRWLTVKGPLKTRNATLTTERKCASAC